MQAQADSGVVQLRGRPQDLVGIFRAAAAIPRRVVVCCRELPGTDGPVDVRGRVTREVDGLLTLRTKLAATTPPGRYACTLRVGEDERPVVIEVEPHPRTRLLADAVDAAGVAGSVHTLTTTVVNLGNVALDVEPLANVRLTDGDLVDAVLSAVAAQSDSDERLRAFADGLASSDGGTVELRVTKGTGTLDPGATREVSAAFVMPSGLRPGRVYAGNWTIGETRYTVRLHPQGEEPAPDTKQPPPNESPPAPTRGTAKSRRPASKSRGREPG
jgi:hypothetical protein